MFEGRAPQVPLWTQRPLHGGPGSWAQRPPVWALAGGASASLQDEGTDALPPRGAPLLGLGSAPGIQLRQGLDPSVPSGAAHGRPIGSLPVAKLEGASASGPGAGAGSASGLRAGETAPRPRRPRPAPGDKALCSQHVAPWMELSFYQANRPCLEQEPAACVSRSSGFWVTVRIWSRCAEVMGLCVGCLADGIACTRRTPLLGKEESGCLRRLAWAVLLVRMASCWARPAERGEKGRGMSRTEGQPGRWGPGARDGVGPVDTEGRECFHERKGILSEEEWSRKREEF